MDITTTGLIGLACFLAGISDQQAENVINTLDEDQKALLQEVECLPNAFESMIKANGLSIDRSQPTFSMNEGSGDITIAGGEPTMSGKYVSSKEQIETDPE